MPRGSRRVQQEYETFIFRVDGWSPSYSFGLGDPKHHLGSYNEHVELQLLGAFLKPSKLATMEVDVRFLGKRDVAEFTLREMHYVPRCVASIDARGKRAWILGSLPMDAMWAVWSALAAGQIRFLQMYGPVLYRGKSLVRYLHFEAELDPDDE